MEHFGSRVTSERRREGIKVGPALIELGLGSGSKTWEPIGVMFTRDLILMA